MRLETGPARELEASRRQAKEMHYPKGRQPSWSLKHGSDMFRFVLYKDHWQTVTKHIEEQSWKPAEQLEGCCTNPGQEILVALTRRERGHPIGVQPINMCALWEWGVEGGWRLQRRARAWEDSQVSAVGSSVVPLTETSNWREVPGGRKVASSLLPEPLTSYFN